MGGPDDARVVVAVGVDTTQQRPAETSDPPTDAAQVGGPRAGQSTIVHRPP